MAHCGIVMQYDYCRKLNVIVSYGTVHVLKVGTRKANNIKVTQCLVI